MKKRETKKTVLWTAMDMALSVAAMAAAFFIRFVLFRGENPVGGFGYHMLWAGLFSPVYARALSGCSASTSRSRSAASSTNLGTSFSAARSA